MARVKNGVNGTVSGKVGPSVFCKWKDIYYVRSLPRIKKNRKPTSGQRKNQSKFAFMQECLSSIVPFVRLGFMQYAPNRTGHNSAMSYNLRESVVFEGEHYRLDYEKFAISRGLPSPVSSAEVNQEDGHVIIRWKVDTVFRQKHGERMFRCIALLYPDNSVNPVNKVGVLQDSYLEDCEQIISLEQVPDGTTYHVYLAFLASDGSNISTDSVYLGEIIKASILSEHLR
ncbi:DUF6266 family protein [Sphingobacterium gobiense]|uniref:Uncharacterized protein n=1 Tax=Sphingobacterium gobiense TaxID=1382456 RepID=A0A2S9JVI4_9SPHI|nr:DUF6266 family protein [Sphingobacterium gobiense]PRD57289.1 hypothetical protein C5749_08870 [Sphingobacterium gobiense]